VVMLLLGPSLDKVSQEALEGAFKKGVAQGKAALVALLLEKAQERIEDNTIAASLLCASNAPNGEEVSAAIYRHVKPRVLGSIFLEAVTQNNTALVEGVLGEGIAKLEEKSLQHAFQRACQQGYSAMVERFLEREAIQDLLQPVIPYCFYQACEEGQVGVVGSFLAQGSVAEATLVTALVKALEEGQEAVKATLLAEVDKAVVQKVWAHGVGKKKYDLLEALLAHCDEGQLDQATIDAEFTKACTEEEGICLLNVLLNRGRIQERVVVVGLDAANQEGYLEIVTTILNSLGKAMLARVLLVAVEQGKDVLIKPFLTQANQEKLGNEALAQAFAKAVAQGRGGIVASLIQKAQERIGDQAISASLLYASNTPNREEVTTAIYNHIKPTVLGRIFVEAVNQNNTALLEGVLVKGIAKLEDTALQYAFERACQQGHSAIVGLFLEREAVKESLQEIIPYFHQACEEGQVGVVGSFLAQGSLPEAPLVTALVKALEEGPEAVKAILLAEVSKAVVEKVWKQGIEEKKACVVEALLAHERARSQLEQERLEAEFIQAVTAQYEHPLLEVLLNEANLGGTFIASVLNAAIEQGKMKIINSILEKINKDTLVEVLLHAVVEGKDGLLPFLLTQAEEVNVGNEAIAQAFETAVAQGKVEIVASLLEKAQERVGDEAISASLLYASNVPKREEVRSAIYNHIKPTVLGRIFVEAVIQNNTGLVEGVLVKGIAKLEDAALQYAFERACQQGHSAIVGLFLEREAVKESLQEIIPYFHQACEEGQVGVVGSFLAQGSLPDDTLATALVNALEEGQEAVKATLLAEVSEAVVQKVWAHGIEEKKYGWLEALLAHCAGGQLDQATIDTEFTKACTEEEGIPLLKVLLNKGSVGALVIVQGLDAALEQEEGLMIINSILKTIGKERLGGLLLAAVEQRKNALLPLLLPKVKKAEGGNVALAQAFETAVSQDKGDLVTIFLKKVKEELGDEAIQASFKTAVKNGNESVVTGLLENAEDKLDTTFCEEAIQALPDEKGKSILEHLIKKKS
ncbi:MAG: hypothetical protein MI674_04675, partial [Cytophagales bacterium]|nr:hypothetical protein [Cytophagales bacterium]